MNVVLREPIFQNNVSPTLPNTGVTAGTYGALLAQVPVIIFDAKGRAVSAVNRNLTTSDIGAATSGHTHSFSSFRMVCADDGETYEWTCKLIEGYPTMVPNPTPIVLS